MVKVNGGNINIDFYFNSSKDNPIELETQLTLLIFHPSSKGKVGCGEHVKSESEVAQLCPTLCDLMDTRLLHLWDFLGKSTGVGCHFLLQGFFPAQGSNPGLLHCRQTLYQFLHFIIPITHIQSPPKA